LNGNSQFAVWIRHKYTYSHIGYNLKATDMQAALGSSQIEKLPQFIERSQREFSLSSHSALKGMEEYLLACRKLRRIGIHPGLVFS